MKDYLLHELVLKAGFEKVKEIIKVNIDLNQLDASGNSPLHWAVLGGYLDIVLVLLQAGADPNVISEDGFTPKWSALDFGLNEIAQTLSDFGGKVNTNENFDTASWTAFKKLLGEELPKTEN